MCSQGEVNLKSGIKTFKIHFKRDRPSFLTGLRKEISNSSRIISMNYIYKVYLHRFTHPIYIDS